MHLRLLLICVCARAVAWVYVKKQVVSVTGQLCDGSPCGAIGSPLGLPRDPRLKAIVVGAALILILNIDNRNNKNNEELRRGVLRFIITRPGVRNGRLGDAARLCCNDTVMIEMLNHNMNC